MTIILLALVLIGGTLGGSPAGAGSKKKRTRKVETAYTEPAVGTAGMGVCFPGSSCVFLEPLPGEKHVRVEVVDKLGLPVYASVIQDTNGDGSYLASDDRTVHICGKTAEPIAIKPGTVTVWVWQGPGANPPCAGFASSGVVRTTFSR